MTNSKSNKNPVLAQDEHMPPSSMFCQFISANQTAADQNINQKMLEKIQYIESYAREHKVPIISKEKGMIVLDLLQRFLPGKVLELGTAIGYSTILFGSMGAHVTTIDRDAVAQEKAKEFCAFFSINATFFLGDCLEHLQQLQLKGERFDLIFVDFEKRKYLDALPLCLKLLNPKGFLISDNINNEKCADYKLKITRHPLLLTDVLTVGDGLAISQKIQLL